MKKNNTIFQFNLKPKYKNSKINWTNADFKNIIRYFIVNKIRYLRRYISYKKIINKIQSEDDLALITSLARPGNLKNQKADKD